MVIRYKLYIDGQWINMNILIVYIIHVECDDIMLNHHLRLDVACDFTYVTNGILVVHVSCNLVLIANYSCKLRHFFSWEDFQKFNA